MRDGSVALVTNVSQDGSAENGECEERIEGLYPDTLTSRALRFPNRKVFWISSRVHPGETPAAHMFNGILGFLLRSNDPRAAALRSLYVFKLVPNLNPDGVFLGHYRTDTRGANLNRCYAEPEVALHPTIWAAREVVLHFARRQELDMYIDLHGHANKRGCFLFGNNLDGPQHVENVLLAKLAALNSPYFDFGGCDFSERNMHAKDRRDPSATKGGSGRVALYRSTELTHIYTCESNYNTVRILNVVPAIQVASKDPKDAAIVARAASPPSKARDPVKLDQDIFACMGRCLAVAVLDLKDANPWSRIPNTEFKTVSGVRNWVSVYLRAQDRKVVKSKYQDE
jgi:hypothetical protein